MSLYDHSQGGIYLQPGRHLCKVTGKRLFNYNTGSPGIEIEVKNERGQTGKIGFCLVEAALWKLASFAKACGLSDADLKKYDPTSENAHKILIGKKFVARVDKPDKYSEITDWELPVVGGEPAPPETRSESKSKAAKPPVDDEPAPTDDEIPF